MSALALLGGLSGGQGGQKFGGDAGPSQSGSAGSGGGSFGGLQFNTGSSPDYVVPGIIAVTVIVGLYLWRR